MTYEHKITTPPRHLSRRAFLAGMGIAGITLASWLTYPSEALAITPTKVSGDSWDDIETGNIFIDVATGNNSFTVNNELFTVGTGLHSSLYPEAYGIYLNKRSNPGSQPILDIGTFTSSGCALDAKTGKKYDLVVDILEVTYKDYPDNIETTDYAPLVVLRGGVLTCQDQLYYCFDGGWSEIPLGTEIKLHASIIDPDTKQVIKSKFQLLCKDIDIRKFSNRDFIPEQIEFLTTPSIVYIDKDSALEPSNNGMCFYSSSGVEADSADRKNLVVALFPTCECTLYWRGSDCGTALFADFLGYPDVPAEPKKNVITPKVWG